MTDDRRFMDLLSDVLAVPPRVAPDGLLGSVLQDVRVTEQRSRGRVPFTRPRVGRAHGLRLAVAAALVCVLASVAIVGLTPLSGLVLPAGTASPAPSPSPSATPQPSRAATSATAMDFLTHLEPGVTYSSELFQPRMTFKVNPRAPATTSDEWCMPVWTSSRLMVFSHAKSCQSQLRVMRPAAVDCGTPDAHPDADALAAAILANPAMAAAVDVGMLQTPGAVPDGMFGAEYHGRVVQIQARLAPFAGAQPCRLILDPGTMNPFLDITGDLSMRLVLIDVHGELLVVQAGGDGSGGTTEFMHLLSIDHEIRFD